MLIYTLGEYCEISYFRREVDEFSALRGIMQQGNNLSVGLNDTLLSRNVGKELPQCVT